MVQVKEVRMVHLKGAESGEGLVVKEVRTAVEKGVWR